MRCGRVTHRRQGSLDIRNEIEASAVKAELYPVRNVHQAFGYGLLAGLAFAGVNLLTRGRWPERAARCTPATRA